MTTAPKRAKKLAALCTASLLLVDEDEGDEPVDEAVAEELE